MTEIKNLILIYVSFCIFIIALSLQFFFFIEYLGFIFIFSNLLSYKMNVVEYSTIITDSKCDNYYTISLFCSV